jgi:hypothetical protein
MAAPNIVNVVNINGKTAVQSIGTSATAIVTNSAGSNKVFKINSLIIANIDGTNPADVTVDLFRSSVSYKIASTVTVPADSSLVVISKGTVIYLEEGDSLRLVASATGDLQGVCSYEEIS